VRLEGSVIPAPYERPKLALSYFWPVFQTEPISVSDSPIVPQAAGDNPTHWTPYGFLDTPRYPAAGGDRGKPYTGAFEESDFLKFGDSAIAGAACGHGRQSGQLPGKGNWQDTVYLGAPGTLWRPFQPQPSSHLFYPESFGAQTQRIVAGTPPAS
jgi:hypothetical protein